MQSRIRKILLALIALAGLAGFASTLHADCDQPDAPDCGCFNNNGPWDAGGPSYPGTLFIQEVAYDTVGVLESCNCPPTFGCDWDPKPTDPDVNFSHAGKPYYQFTLGQNLEAGALFLAELMAYNPAVSFHPRQNWCSEVVSYWHRETSLPYLYGFRTDYHPDWLIDNVADLRAWYMAEERLVESGHGGRGIWISSSALDYSEFEPGVNAPLPGSYIAFADYDDGTPPAFAGLKYSHSAIIDEMWVHRNAYGNVIRVAVSLLEGNVHTAGGQAVVATPDTKIPDLYTYTPNGSQNLGHYKGRDDTWNTADDVYRRIYGFGIDLDEHGQPVYDPDRLHEVAHPEILYAVATIQVQVEDEAWNQYALFMEDLVDYAKDLRQVGGPVVKWGEKSYPLPDGQSKNAMTFPKDFVGEVIIDLMGPHPLPICGIELTWSPGALPLGYTVEFFGESQQSSMATVPDYSQLVPPPKLPTPVPIMLDEPFTGVNCVRLFFPEGSIAADSELLCLSVRFEGSPWEDAPGESLEQEIPVFVDVKPGSCPNSLRPRQGGVVPVAILGTWNFDVTAIDPASVTPVGSGIFPLRWAYEDVATPFIGPSRECHSMTKDRILDLTLKFDAKALAEYLEIDAHAGETIPLLLEGVIKDVNDVTMIRGRDWIRVLGAPKGPQKLGK